MAYPFRKMTTRELKKRSQDNRDLNLTDKYSEPPDVMTNPKTRSIEDLNPQRQETNQSQLPH